MGISLKSKSCIISALALSIMVAPLPSFAMGGKPEVNQDSSAASQSQISSRPASTLSSKEVGRIFWPDSDSTEAQQEETLKNLLGKRVNWAISVAQVQRDGNGYLIQGQSDKDMVGTFSYVNPATEKEKAAILKSARGTTLHIEGIVQDMNMRHLVLRPARVVTEGK